MSDTKRKQILQLLMIVLFAAALKYYYSAANANELRWILAPTAASVETVTGAKFVFESYSGYLKSDKSFLIAASCSGVNFLVTAFLLLSIGKVWRNRSRCLKWRFLLYAFVSAYLATIIANTVRISTALQLHNVGAGAGFFDSGQLHRIEGIVVYFGFLLLLFFISGKIDMMTNKEKPVTTSRIRNLFLPLLIYYITTIAVPFANGAYSQGAVFWKHTLFVFTTPLILLAPFIVVKFIANRRPAAKAR